ncbi:MAG: hypothetical protein HYX48_03525 [Chlamydiales bacterium]|nr:hypothetical protein [Chlamydiales bacterium]
MTRVSGPSPQEPGRKDKASAADAQKFQELMKSRKVGEVDEEQKKGRKRKDESEAEAEADTEGVVSAQPDATLKGAPSPFTPEKGVGKVGGALKAQASEAAPESQRPSLTSPAAAPLPSTTDDDSFLSNLPAAAPRANIETSPLPPSSYEEAPEEPIQETYGDRSKEAQLSQEPAKEAPRQAEKATEAKKREIKSYKEIEKSVESKAKTEEEVLQKEAEQLQKGESTARDAEQDAFFQGITKDQRQKMEEEAQAGRTGVSSAAPAEGGKGRKEEKKIDEVSASTGAQSGAQAPLPDNIQPLTPTAPTSYAYLHPQVLDMFERMVGVMTVMSNAGISETTLTLNAPQYQNSVFFGAQIIIKEYATAQKSFNIQLIGSPQGVALFQANIDDLMAAFQGGKYNFKVNRIETALSSEKPLFHRKEGVGKDEKERDSNK